MPGLNEMCSMLGSMLAGDIGHARERGVRCATPARTIREKKKMLNREQISKDAWAISRAWKNVAYATHDTQNEPRCWAMVGVGETLANDACDCSHTLKSLRRRLREYGLRK